MAAAKDSNAKKEPGLFIRSFNPSYRRCGHRWNREGTRIAESKFTKEELKTLKEDKGLIVVEEEIEVTE